MGVIQHIDITSTIPTLSLDEAATKVLEEHYKHNSRYRQTKGVAREACRRTPGIRASEITTDWLRDWVTDCSEGRGNSVSTINIKLSFISKLLDHNKAALDREARALGAKYERPEIPWMDETTKTVKWWLTPDLEKEVLAWCRGANLDDFAEYIEWTTWTGLRLTETLRVQRLHFANFDRIDTCTLTVPGTKTDEAQRTVPLFPKAYDIARRRFGYRNVQQADFLFEFDYEALRTSWNRVRDVFKLHKDPTATVKNLRRAFAKRATHHSMPTSALQQYLGHESIKTTEGYLKVVGGYNVDVMRKWVS